MDHSAPQNLSSADDSSKIDIILKHVLAIHADVEVLKTDLGKVADRFEPIEREVGALQQEVCRLNSEILNLKKAARACNLILFNIPDTEEVNLNLSGSILSTFQSANIDLRSESIVAVSRLGNKIGNRPVKICFSSKLKNQSLTTIQWKREIREEIFWFFSRL